MLLHYMLKTLFNEIVVFRTSAASRKVCELRATTFLQQAPHFRAVLPSRAPEDESLMRWDPHTSNDKSQVLGLSGMPRNFPAFPFHTHDHKC